MIIGRIIPLFLGFIMLKSLLARSLMIACCTFAVGYSTQSYAVDDELGLELSEEEMVDTPIESIQKFVEVYSLVKQNYVKSISDEQLFANAMQGLLKGLDPYSRYLSAQDYQDLLKYTDGELGTVDFDLIYLLEQQEWVIHNLKNNTDSYKLGLRNGTVVSKIADQPLTTLNYHQIQELLTGPLGSKISIQLSAESKPITLALNKKKNLDIQARLLAEQQVLLIQIPVFTQETAHEVQRIYDDFAEQQQIKMLMIDLRNNPGGLLSAAVETADLFLEQGLIVTTKSRAEGNQNFRASTGNTIKTPVSILINKKSASAAEVFTAALQQHQRARVIGEKSYGKGVVQKVLSLGNGDAVSLTVADYYTPDGQQLEGKGIEPNILYPLATDVNEQDYLERVATMLITYVPQN